jgi:Tfp pilus assembly protein PilE
MRRAGIGFGLVALLVVIVIIAILFTMQTGTGGSYTQQIGQTKRQGVEVSRQIATQQLSILISQYRQENNRLPKSPEDMDSAAFRDEWGNPMTFTFKGEGEVTRVTYRSNGPDGVPNTPDDITRQDTLPY